MSHSNGLIKFKKDNKIMHCEYNGTCDVMRAKLFETFEEMDKYWREEQPITKGCNCELEEVEIYSTYGNGFYWKGKACRKCMEIGENFIPNGTDREGNDYWSISGEPKWATEYYKQFEI